MRLKNTTLSLFFLLSFAVFSQQVVEVKPIQAAPIPLSYLDSIRQTFVRHTITDQVDSLWMKELTSLDIYEDLTKDIQTLNTDKSVDFELPTELLKQRLAIMDAKSPFHIEYNQGLENLIKSFLKNRKKAFARLMATSEYYFPIFEEALAKKNIPLEIKYLSIVESALNPKAVSKVGATGLWQFMYQTGKQYNLRIDSYVDERSDPLKSSEAAAQYMANMYPLFNDWDLVLASYNSGPGNVTKAIRRSGGQQNFWDLKKHLPQETQGYVPAFLATMYLYEFHKEHGIKPERATFKHFQTDTIRIQKEISFKQIADLIDIPVVELQLLNPSYKMQIIPVYGDQPNYLRLPQSKIAVFTSNEDKIYAYAAHDNTVRRQPLQWHKTALASKGKPRDSSDVATINEWYKIKKGDNLNTVAEDYKVAVADLKRWNGIKGNSVPRGKLLKIKTVRAGAETNTTALASAVIAGAKSTEKTKENLLDSLAVSPNATQYVVQKGDNWNTIARKYNVSVDELCSWNPNASNNLKLGMSLQIGPAAAIAEHEVVKPDLKDITYTVVEGDNLGTIAKKFGTTPSNLLAWNAISKNKLSVGVALIVAKNEVAIVTNNATANSFKKRELFPTAKAKNATNDYYVKKGDSLFSISKKYPGVTIADLKKWNGITSADLKPGMKLKING
jgi:membrane-bound lytic murein transglycosylase D